MKLEVGKRYEARGRSVFEIESETDGCFVSTEGFKFKENGRCEECTENGTQHRYDLMREVGAPVEKPEMKESDLNGKSYYKVMTHSSSIPTLENRIATLEQTLATLIAETKQIADNVIVFQDTVSNALKELVPFVLETRMKNGK